MSGHSENASGTSPLQTWKVGDVTITKVLESQHVIDLASILPQSTPDALLALPWLQPHFVTPRGEAIMSAHALVVDTPTTRIIVDTCVGNDKDRAPWDWGSNLQTAFLHTLEGNGFPRDSFDIVLCTHLHFDHIGWNTMLVDGRWTPTFPKARYLFNRTEYEYWASPSDLPQVQGWENVQGSAFADSIKPVLEAGLMELVEGVHKVCDEVSLIPTVGHSPGHVSVRISSRGEEALITGDIAHHPCQLAHLRWRPDIDFDPEQAADTRARIFSDAADRAVLVIGTHWANASAGTVMRSEGAYWLRS